MLIEPAPNDVRPEASDQPDRTQLEFNRAQAWWWCFVAAQLVVMIVLFVLLIV